ncbi:MAG: hypothetical protein WBV94_18590 [Blastocatellia bacterium]
MSALAFQSKSEPKQFTNTLRLPGPRVWEAKQLADFLKVKPSWVYNRTKGKAANKIPRCPGVGHLRFDTWSPAFQTWMIGILSGGADTE